MSDIKPFNTMFGVKPESYITRQETNEVLNALQESPTGYIHLTGIRGSGKTVFMTSIADQLKADRQWIVIDLNPEISIYESPCKRLSDALKLHLTDTSVSLSAEQFSMYRERLIVKGIIVSRRRGEFEVVLPRFGEYLNNRKEYEAFNSIFE